MIASTTIAVVSGISALLIAATMAIRAAIDSAGQRKRADDAEAKNIELRWEIADLQREIDRRDRFEAYFRSGRESDIQNARHQGRVESWRQYKAILDRKSEVAK